MWAYVNCAEVKIYGPSIDQSGEEPQAAEREGSQDVLVINPERPSPSGNVRNPQCTSACGFSCTQGDRPGHGRSSHGRARVSDADADVTVLQPDYAQRDLRAAGIIDFLRRPLPAGRMGLHVRSTRISIAATRPAAVPHPL